MKAWYALWLLFSVVTGISASEWKLLPVSGNGAVITEKGGVIEVLSGQKDPRRARGMICRKIPCQPGKYLAFEYRNIAPPLTVFAPNHIYIAIPGGASRTVAVTHSVQWRTCRLPMGDASCTGKNVTAVIFSARLALRQITVPHGFAIRNIRLETDPAYDPETEIPHAVSAIPHLDWRRGKAGDSFSVVFSCGQEKKVYEKIRNNWFAPPEPLPPGVWKVIVYNGKKAIRQDLFRVTADTPRWKAPAVDMERLKNLPRPRLKGIAAHWNPDPAKLEQQAKQALNYRTPDNPPAYDPQDSRFKSWADYHRIVNAPVHTTGMKLHYLAAAYYRERRPEYRDKAREILMKVARTWDPEGGSHLRAGDLRAASLLQGMCIAYDAFYDELTLEERRDAAQNIRIRAKQFWNHVNPNGNGDGNHRWHGVSVQAFAALALGEDLQRFEYAVSLFAYRFLPNLGHDGEGTEGLHYWGYGIGLALQFLEWTKIAGGVDLYQQPWVRQTARFPLYSQPVGGFAVSFGDNGSPNHMPHKALNKQVAKFAEQTGDREALYFAGHPEKGPVRVPLWIPQSKHFRHLGAVIFNTFLPDARANVQLGFRSGKYFNNHQHADQNGFVINAYGDKLAVDGGYYDSTDSPHFLFYSVASMGHNTILVNGQGQSIHCGGADGRIADFLELPDFGYVEGDASNFAIYSGMLTKFRRKIVFAKPDYIVVYDELAAPDAATFRFLLHAQQDTGSIRVKGKDFLITRPAARLAGTVILPEHAVLQSGKADYVSPPRLWDSAELNPHVLEEQILSVRNPAPRKTLQFLVPMQVLKNGEQVKWQKLQSPDAVGVQTHDAVIAFNLRPGKTAKLGKLTFDGPAAAVRFRQGKVLCGMRKKGHILRWEGADVPVRENYDLTREDCSVSWNGEEIPAEKTVKRLPDGRKIECVSAVLPATEGSVLTVQTGNDSKDRYMILSSPVQEWTCVLPAGTKKQVVFYGGRKAVFTMTSTGEIGRISVTALGKPIPWAVAEDHAFRPAEGAVLVEGEARLEGVYAPGMLKRAGTSGGMISHFWRPGAIGEWELQVPETGEYLLHFRMANGKEWSNFREVRVDGMEPVFFHTGGTGGFGHSPAQWRWFRMPGKVFLKAGTHRISVRCLRGTGNLDCFSVSRIR